MDLYLIHQPCGDFLGAWKALEEAKLAGKIKSIGVSKMSPKIYSELVPQFSTLPAVNQVECNPTFQQKELRSLMDKSGKNAGQIILRFEVQEGFIGGNYGKKKTRSNKFSRKSNRTGLHGLFSRLRRGD